MTPLGGLRPQKEGIGFKSFFKIAVSIHICSRGYKFKFDSNRLCGIVIPEWAVFPVQHKRLGMIQFLLELRSDAPKSRIKEDLRTITTNHLLFLRRLKKLKVCVMERRQSLRVRIFKTIKSTVERCDGLPELVLRVVKGRKRIPSSSDMRSQSLNIQRNAQRIKDQRLCFPFLWTKLVPFFVVSMHTTSYQFERLIS
jgi:hypothetical protein